MRPFARKQMALKAQASHMQQSSDHGKMQSTQASLSIRRLCHLFSISLSGWHYQSKTAVTNEVISQALLQLASAHRTWGFGLMFLHLRNVQGKPWNHKRVYRIYCQLRLNLRIKPHQRIVRERPQALQTPVQPNSVWSMDFMHGQLGDARSYRSLNVLDDFNRELLCAEIDISLPTSRVTQALGRVIEWRGKPAVIRSDNGPEYISQEMKDWAGRRGITLWFIQPGHPQQNAYVERFNCTMRYELFNPTVFGSIEEVQLAATQWQYTYNHDRPHMALNGQTPAQKLQAYISVHQPSTLH